MQTRSLATRTPFDGLAPQGHQTSVAMTGSEVPGDGRNALITTPVMHSPECTGRWSSITAPLPVFADTHVRLGSG